jgi:multiple sugar transport system ATP-binding protein
MASVRLESIRKSYRGGHEALRGIDLALADGELLVLVGPSGCGKSTVLRIVAGLEAPSAGRVHIAGRDVTGWPPRDRDVAMVFQSYALYPHKTVAENLGFGMRMRGASEQEIARRTREIAERLAIAALLARMPAELSGGQRQRVALGRALVRQPQVFLLDEPLSNLDAKLRAEMRAEIGRLHASFPVTTLYVTHDQEEAMTLGHRIAVLGAGGRIEQVGPPLEVYKRPASAFVAEFIGMPRINWFDGDVDGVAFSCPDFRLTLPGPPRPRVCARLGLRPHDLTLAEPGHAVLRAEVELVEALGATTLVHARTEHGCELRIVVPADAAIRRGDPIGATIAGERAHLFDAQSGLRV